MEILFAVPFVLFAALLWEARALARISFPEDRDPSTRIDRLPRDDSWLLDVERFDLMLTPHRRRSETGKALIAPAGQSGVR